MFVFVCIIPVITFSYFTGKEEVAGILIDNSAPIEAETRKGFTPLHLAAKYGDINVARLLLARGAQPDAPGKSHITPLHMATYYGHPDIALLLLDKGNTLGPLFLELLVDALFLKTMDSLVRYVYSSGRHLGVNTWILDMF